MGEKLKAARTAAALTQSQLAQLVGCSQKDISRWESGAVEPGVLTAKRIAAVLGCKLDDIV